MFCTKKLFWLSVLTLLLGLTFIKTQDVVSSVLSVNDGLKGSCSCGGFPTNTPDVISEPLLSQSPGLVVNCDDEGATTCKNLCLALATAAKAKGPEILCARLKDAKELKLSAFYKLCSEPWSYANMTADELLCCEDSKVKACPSIESSDTNANMAAVLND